MHSPRWKFLWLALLASACMPPTAEQETPLQVVEEEPAPSEPEPVEPEVNATIVTTRPAHFPGFVPPAELLADAPSKWLTPTPELDFRPENPESTPGVFLLKPELGGWNNVPLADPSIHLYLATPGDYTDWGLIPITTSGSATQKKVIRYYDPKEWKYDPPHAYFIEEAGRSANFEGIESKEEGGTSHWTFDRLTFKGKGFFKGGVSVGGLGVVIGPGSSHYVIQNSLFWKFAGARIYGNHMVFQRNVTGGSMGVKGDHGAIGIFTTKEHPSEDGRIVANELRDGADLIGLPKDGVGAEEFQFVDGTVIADNDLYWTEDARRVVDGKQFNCGGDAIDIKNGAASPTRPVIIENNRIRWDWPTPPDKSCGDNTGSVGQGIITHKDVRHVVIRNNLFMDSSTGITSRPGESKGMSSHHIAVVNNLFYRLEAQIPDVGGHAWLFTAPEVDVFHNSVFQVDQLLAVSKNGKEVLNLYGNRVVGAGGGIPVSDKLLVVKDNHISSESDLPLGDMEIWWRRITAPEKIRLQGVVLHQPELEQATTLYTFSETQSVLESRWFKDFVP